MDIPFALPEAEGINLALRPGGVWGGAKIVSCGQVLPKKKGKFIVTLPDGREVPIGLKFGLDIFTPSVEVNNQIIDVAPKLPAYQAIWSGLPLAMIAFGGALGGGLGAMAAVLNLKIFRWNLSLPLKFVLTLLVSLASVLIWLCGVVLIYTLLPGNK